jgi:sugar lactone lactonase YvrE
VLTYLVAPDGALTPGAAAMVPEVAGKPGGMAIDPEGRWLAFTTTTDGALVVLDAMTLAPVEDGVRHFHPYPGRAGGVTFDGAGRLFVTHEVGVSVYSLGVGELGWRLEP